MTILLKGKEVAAQINAETSEKVLALKSMGITPTLAILRTGESADAVAYEKNASRACEKRGIACRTVSLPENTAKEDYIEAIEALNCDDKIHGILILKPYPKSVSGSDVRNALNPGKDVEGITPAAYAGVYSGEGEYCVPCTAEACLKILDYYGINPSGKNAVVVGRSLTVGRPAAMLLTGRDATVTLCHSKTENLQEIVRRADIIIAACKQKKLLGAECFTQGQYIIDAGFHEDGDTYCGDVDFDAACDVAAGVTPVPGGVGGVTTALLMAHTVSLAQKKQ